MTCVTLQPMMLQVNIHLILHQIIPLQVILHQINLMEIRRLVQGLATDVGHLRTEQVEIKRMAETGRRSRSPLRRRRWPTPPSPPRRRRSPSFSRKLPPWRHSQASRGRSLGRDRSPSSRPAPSRPISSRPAPRSPDHPPPHSQMCQGR